ncbi:MAG: hypothetical protein JWP89_3137 [Schlesneria sp.]|nr:hypothetical protein [Schlesneria sp.]
MDRIAYAAIFGLLGFALVGCFALLTGTTKPPSGPFVTGWKARMIGLIALMSIPIAWVLAQIIVLATMLIGVSLSLELVIIFAVAGSIIATYSVMHHFSWKWVRMNKPPSECSNLGDEQIRDE